MAGTDLLWVRLKILDTATGDKYAQGVPMLSRRHVLTSFPICAIHSARAMGQALESGLTFRSTAPIVFAPTVVLDERGKFVRGLEARDFALFDNNVKQSVNVEEESAPISVALALHATEDARKPLHRLRQVISLFGPLIAGETGSLALIAFRDDVEVVEPFTSNFPRIERAVKNLVANGYGCSYVDAVRVCAELLAARPPDNRKVIIVMTEERDRSSKADLGETLSLLQKHNTTVYSLTYSPGLMQLAREVPTGPCRYVSAPVWRDQNFANALGALSKQGKVADVFAASTGGRNISFFRESTLGHLITEIGEELHAQYLLSFEPKDVGSPRTFRRISVELNSKSNRTVRTRAGYWFPSSPESR